MTIQNQLEVVKWAGLGSDIVKNRWSRPDIVKNGRGVSKIGRKGRGLKANDKNRRVITKKRRYKKQICLIMGGFQKYTNQFRFIKNINISGVSANI